SVDRHFTHELAEVSERGGDIEGADRREPLTLLAQRPLRLQSIVHTLGTAFRRDRLAGGCQQFRVRGQHRTGARDLVEPSNAEVARIAVSRAGLVHVERVDAEIPRLRVPQVLMSASNLSECGVPALEE